LLKSVFQIDYVGRCGKPFKVLSTSASRTLAGMSRSSIYDGKDGNTTDESIK